ncbi:MAG: hypothetical protein ACP5JG_05835 [Anaerolineae bacterium]
MIVISPASLRAHNAGLCLLLIITSLVFPCEVAADGGSLQVHGIAQQDLDGDGQPNLAAIRCSFATDRDKVYVYDGGKDMAWGADWAETTDFDNDTWVFDVGSNGDAQLIILFGTSGSLATARVYDDRDGDGYVAYHSSGSKIEVTESPYWTVQVVSHQGWRLADGSLSSNVEISIDGVIKGNRWSAGSSLSNGRESVLLTDGVRDRVIEGVDADQDGVMDYLLERLVTPSVADGGFSARLYTNIGQRRSREYEDHVFWPLLVGTHRYEAYRYFDHPPAVSVIWSESKVDRAGLMGYPIEEGFHINSYAPWSKGVVNYANFGNPMAFYDLAEDSDGEPELFVKLETYGPYDGRVLGGRFSQPLVEVEYAWDQDNSDMTFDYQLSLVGKHAVESVVRFPDFGVRAVPYANVPPWVTERAWEVGVFTVAEDGGRRGSEGMHSWLVGLGMEDGIRVDSGIKNLYVTGVLDEAPTWAYSEIDQGRRGEISYSFRSQPHLYFSPVDRKLHLPGIDHGVWNVDGMSTVEYADLRADGFIDQWRFFIGHELQRVLIAASGFLIYAGDGTIQMKQVDVPEALFYTLPPRNRQEWLELDRLLTAYDRDFGPGDFEAMLNQFDGPITRIDGAKLRDYRPTESGFRFVLELGPNFLVGSDPHELSAHLSAPGAYAVAHDDDGFGTRPLTPPALSFKGLHIGPSTGSPQELVWTTLEAELHNDGLEDVHNLSVCAKLIGPEDQSEVLTDTVALLPGEGSVPLVWHWAPPVPGAWTVQLTTGCEAGAGLPLGLRVALQTRVEVDPRSAPAPAWFASLAGHALANASLILAGAALLGGGAMVLWLRMHAGTP